MSSLIVSASELDYRDEYDPMHEVFYGVEPFTGVAQYEQETTTYVNGKAHGRYALRFANGCLSAEGTYAEGECLTLRSWYEDGTLRGTFQAAGLETKKWAHDGILAYQAEQDAAGVYQNRWFFKDGTVKQHYTANRGTAYFAADGRLAMQVTYGPSVNSVTYIDNVLKTSYFDVLTNYFVEAPLEKSTVEWYFWGWIWRLLGKSSDRPTALAILQHLKAAQFDSADQLLASIRTIDLDTFQPSLSYRIEA